ncbi:MAG TPA: ADP-forming succinate--CoA ligase subunit beta, partial [Candidatus Latescibacteria bacterium]|nr:ADP-forming succinate--CoA ligase subunit beta [Candidatus Latescibacterota bacterium]
GIKLVSTPEEAAEAAGSLLGTRLVTPQTGPEGVPIGSVLIEEAVEVAKEMYVGVVIDGAAGGPLVIASEAGGMEIEEVAESAPEKILRAEVDPVLGLQPYQGRKLAYGLNSEPALVRPIAELIGNLYDAFVARDCSLVEINPLVITADGRLLAVDAKLSIDDDALFRHPDLLELRDPLQEDPLDSEAAELDLNYVKLDGDVGCIVNGAGLGMATMDVIEAAGASPANFLDIGGSANEEKVAQALKIIVSDPSVKRVLVNVFGGILRCDVVARGLLLAAEGLSDATPPIVVRMLGTNAEEVRKIMSDSNLDITLVDDLNEAAEAIRAA